MNPRPMLVAVGAQLLLAALALPAFAQAGAQDIASADEARAVEILQSPDAQAFEKAKACQRLAVVGTADAVPALAALLDDEALNTYARTALEGIRDPATDEALRDAAEKLEGRQLVGVLQSIGKRRDKGAVKVLKGYLDHSDPQVAAAAARSLGRAAPAAAVEALTSALAAAKDKSPLADACLVAAGALAEDGKTEEAIRLYEASAGPEIPSHLRADALGGKMRLLGSEAKDLLLEQIRSDDERLFNLGLAMAREMPGADVANGLRGELENLPPERRALLLIALGDRPEPVPASLLESALRSDTPKLREAAVRVLAESDDADALAMLFDMAMGDGEVAIRAREGLRRHPSNAVNDMILAKLKGSDGARTVVLLDLVGARGVDSARETAIDLLEARDAAVRTASLNALAQIVTPDDLDLLIKHAVGEGSSDETTAARDALATAALRMTDREATAARLAETLEGAPVDYQVSVLELLGRMGGKTSLRTVAAAAKSPDAEIKDAATRVLGAWPNADASPVLLEVARTDRESRYRIRALRGYLRIARQLQLPPETRLEMFDTAMELAQRDNERQLALNILSRIPSAQTLQTAVAYLDQPGLRDTAADVATLIAPRVLDSEPQAVADAMQKVIDSGAEGQARARGRQLLNQAQSRLR